ncbi:MAG: metallophosphoesterase [Deltaproteobacteria bacterium]|jgi:serine/threonine protein phosphatase 1|nr:metallophosphoesterase [Deltaproteobacteria bacterium]
MIWVIGDIHGMIRPLRRIIDSIEKYQAEEAEENDPLSKIIFLGDFIDHGLHSKEVIDLVLDLKYPTVCLLGNHDDLALRHIYEDPNYKRDFNHVWFENGNQATVDSLLPKELKSKQNKK